MKRRLEINPRRPPWASNTTAPGTVADAEKALNTSRAVVFSAIVFSMLARSLTTRAAADVSSCPVVSDWESASLGLLGIIVQGANRDKQWQVVHQQRDQTRVEMRAAFTLQQLHHSIQFPRVLVNPFR